VVFYIKSGTLQEKWYFTWKLIYVSKHISLTSTIIRKVSDKILREN
jgi:hypothetical protein